MTPQKKANLFHLRESQKTVLELSNEQAAGFARVGQRLAVQNHGSTEDYENRTIIRSYLDFGSGTTEILVDNAIGAISSGEAQIIVRPKIPENHLFYLFEQSEAVPRVDEQISRLIKNKDQFLEIVAKWFLIEVRQVLARGLVRDYRSVDESLKSPKGKILVGESMPSWYKGNFSFKCSFEEFDEDNPANRILASACLKILKSSFFTKSTKKEARKLYSEFPEIGLVRSEDLRFKADRRSQYYDGSLRLAKNILSGTGRKLEHGNSQMYSILIKTPLLVEKGIRKVLKEGLAPHHTVSKKESLRISKQHTLNPDIVFNDGTVIGDIKYKLLSDSWNRPDLNQLTTFAAGFHALKGVVIGFTKNPSSIPQDIRVGKHLLRVICWNASGELSPHQAGKKVIQEVSEFLSLKLAS